MLLLFINKLDAAKIEALWRIVL